MSNIIQKAKEVITGHERTTDTTGTSGTTHRAGTHGVGTTTDTSATGRTAGPHRSDLANKLDPRVDSDRDGSRTIGTTGKTPDVGGYGSHHGTTNYGPHNTNLGNKLDPTVDSNLDSSHRATGGGAYTSGGLGTTTGKHHTTTGPHNSGLLNKADPRVDSDRDGSRNLGATTYGPGATHGSAHGTGYSDSTNAGPHRSNIANKLDPRVDSDLDGSRNMGMRDRGTTIGTTGLSSSGTDYGTGYGSTNAGPHGSNVANKLDPRVDSDRDHRASGTTGYYGTTGGTSTNYGPHSTNIANKLDPRVDSDLDHRGSGAPGLGYGPGTTIAGTTHDNTHGASYGTTTGTPHGVRHTGPAPHTAGPHKSDIMNKVDPRVDSDLDGSKTVGRDQTFATPGSHHAGKNTADAAQVPPSLFQKDYGTVTGRSKGDAS